MIGGGPCCVTCVRDSSISLECMVTAERLDDICRFHDLLQATLTDSNEPLSRIQRQVAVNMMGELIAHAKETMRA